MREPNKRVSVKPRPVQIADWAKHVEMAEVMASVRNKFSETHRQLLPTSLQALRDLRDLRTLKDTQEALTQGT
jgi:hypothetical protein